MTTPKKVIVDTDMGWDDWLAILFLMQHPDVQLLGITVTGVGEAHLKPGVQNALNLLELGGKKNVPVCAGTSKPLIYSNVFPADFRAQIDKMFNLELPVSPISADPRSAVDFLRQTLQNANEPITILSLGGLTNLGTLLCSYPREFDDKIERIYIMGGAIKADGNVAPFGGNYPTNTTAEWNIFVDVLGAQIVINSDIPITLVPLDVTNQVELTLDFVLDFAKAARTPCADFAAKILISKLGQDISQGFQEYFYDPLAAAVMVGTDGLVTETENLKLRVVQDLDEADDHSGQLIIDDSQPMRPIQTCISVNGDIFKKTYIDILNRIWMEAES